MRTVQPAISEKLVSITCDRCGAVGSIGDDLCDAQEFLSYSDMGGYSSLADGAVKSIDLCERCVVEALGKWLRISSEPPSWASWTPEDAQKVQDLVRTCNYENLRPLFIFDEKTKRWEVKELSKSDVPDRKSDLLWKDEMSEADTRAWAKDRSVEDNQPTNKE